MSIFKYYQYQPQYYKKYFPLFLGYCEDSRFGSCHNVDPEVPNNFSRHFAKEKVPAAVILSSDWIFCDVQNLNNLKRVRFILHFPQLKQTLVCKSFTDTARINALKIAILQMNFVYIYVLVGPRRWIVSRRATVRLYFLHFRNEVLSNRTLLHTSQIYSRALFTVYHSIYSDYVNNINIQPIKSLKSTVYIPLQ